MYVRVGDRDDAPVGGERDLILGGAHQLAGEAAHGPGPPRPLAVELRRAWTRVTRAHAGAVSNEATEVRGLGQRPLDAGRGDLERVALAQVVQRQRHALA